MRIVLFGELAVVHEDVVIRKFPTHRAAALLGFLAFYRGPHSREMLAEMLWPGGNPDAIRFRLNQTLAEVRKTLKCCGDPVISDRFSLQLSPSVRTDVQVFYDALGMADSIEGKVGRANQLAHAVHLARQELLPKFFEDWAVAARNQVTAQLIVSLQEWADLSESIENWSELIEVASRLGQLEPYSEPVLQKHLRALVATGDRVAAVRLYEEFASRLREDFAIEPSRETQEVVASLRSPAESARITANGRQPTAVDPNLEKSSWRTGSIDHVLHTYIDVNDAERAMRFAASLLTFWNLRGELSVARRWLKRIFAMPSAVLAPPDARCVAMITFGIAAVSVADFQGASIALTRALELAKASRNQKLIAEALRGLGHSALRQGQFDAARRLFEESLVPSLELDDLGGIADSWTGIGEALRFASRFDEAEKAHRKAYDLRIRVGRPDRAAHSLLNLGIIASRTERYDFALSQIREALSVLRTQGSRAVVADCLMEIAGACAYRGHPFRAVRLLAGVSKLRESISAPLPLSDRPDYVRFLGKARDLLRKEEFGFGWEFGQAASLDEILDEALLIDLL